MCRMFCQSRGHMVILSTAVLCLVTQSCLTLCDPMVCSPPGSSVPGDSPDKNTRVGCHALLQGIFPTQDLNPGLPHCRWILYLRNHQEISYPLSHSFDSHCFGSSLGSSFFHLYFFK